MATSPRGCIGSYFTQIHFFGLVVVERGHAWLSHEDRAGVDAGTTHITPIGYGEHENDNRFFRRTPFQGDI